MISVIVTASEVRAVNHENRANCFIPPITSAIRLVSAQIRATLPFFAVIVINTIQSRKNDKFPDFLIDFWGGMKQVNIATSIVSLALLTPYTKNLSTVLPGNNRCRIGRECSC